MDARALRRAVARVLLVLARLPDTPRWYLMKGRHDDARRTLAKTDPEADAERELAEIEEDLRGERGGPWARCCASPICARRSSSSASAS